MAVPTIGFAGKISKGGTPTTLTAAACSLVSGKTYQINSAANRVLDPNTAITVLDNGATVAAANILNVNAMNGQVTFVPGYTPTTPITITGKYIPRAAVASVKAVKSAPKRKTVDVTVINQGGYEMVAPTLLGWDGSFEVIDYASDQGLDALLLNGTPVLLDYDPLGTGASVTRGWVVLTSEGGDIEPGAALVTPVAFTLYDQSTGATALSGFRVNAAFAFNTT